MLHCNIMDGAKRGNPGQCPVVPRGANGAPPLRGCPVPAPGFCTVMLQLRNGDKKWLTLGEVLEAGNDHVA